MPTPAYGADMRQLHVRMDAQIAFLTVAEKGSFAGAGKHLGITKSAVRKKVHGIELELGTQLFRLAGKHMALTDAGSIYLPEIRESIRHARLGMDRVRAFVQATRNDLRIGYSSYLSEKLLDVIAELPSTGEKSSRIRREGLLTYQAISKVLRGDLHVGFGFLPLNDPDLLVQPLVEEPLMVCLPSGHRLSTKHTIEPEDLHNQPAVAVARRALPGRHEEIVKHFESLGISLKFAADAYLPREALWLVSKGAGFALMTRSSAAAIRSDVLLRPLSDRLLTVKSGAFARRDQFGGHIKELLDSARLFTTALRPLGPKPKSPNGL